MQSRQRRYFDENGLLIIKPYRLKDLCVIFDLTHHVMRAWIKENKELIGERKGHYFNAEQVTFIIGRFGMPFINNNYKKEIF